MRALAGSLGLTEEIERAPPGRERPSQIKSGQVSHGPEAGPLVRVMWGENPSRSPSHCPNLEVKSSACWQGLRPPPESQQKQCQLSDARIQAAHPSPLGAFRTLCAGQGPG